MMFILHSWRRVVFALTTGLFGIVFDARVASADPNDYEVNLRVPEGLIACNDRPFFKTQYAFARGKRRFASHTLIDVLIKPDGSNGFDLDVAFKSAAQGALPMARNRKYPSTVECSRIVSDAAEIAAEMMAPTAESPHTPITPDHRFVIEVPPELEACNDVEFLEKWFERARGSLRFQQGWPKLIHIKNRGTMNTRVWADVVLRSPSGRIVHDVNGRPIDDISYDFNGPTECAKVMSYVAQKLPMAFWPPPEPKRSYPIIPVPLQPPKLHSLAWGWIYQRDLVTDVEGSGMQFTYVRTVHPLLRLRADTRLFMRLPFQTGSEGLTRVRLDYLGTISLGACAVWKVFHACALGAVGRAQVEAINFQSAKISPFSVAHGGALFSAETPPVSNFFLRAEAGMYLNAPRGYKLTYPRSVEMQFVEPSPFGWTWSIVGGLHL
ncbi:MAG TPA: hypothetical protein PK156_02265 [Polyangium sp.]|nr:hypothetical protein [Polyangium sp.]